MTPELARFIQSFKTEASLHNATAALLSRMPNIEGVHITHGTQEYGKDVIFRTSGALGDKRLVACVIKRDKIKGSAESDQGARTVLIQAQQALDTPVLNDKGNDEFVEHVYIISPYDCPPTSMNSIRGQMRHRSGQITFVCGDDLFRLFQTYWKEYFFFDSGYLGSYLATLRDGMSTDAALVNVLYRHTIFASDPKSLLSVYVDQAFKVLLQPFVLKERAWPVRAKIQDTLSLLELNKYTASLQTFARLLRHMQPWSSSGIFGEELEALATSIASIADHLSDGSGRKIQQNGEMEILPKHKARLIDALGAAETYLGVLKRKIVATNDFCKAHRHVRPTLGTKYYLDYCRLQEISHVAHAVVQYDADGKDFVYDDDLLDRVQCPLLVTAPAGYGKTSFCRRNVYRDIERLSRDISRVIPIYVPMHQLSQGPIGSFEETFFRVTELHSFLQSSKANEWSFRLYLDGLDEVPSAARQRELMKLVKEGIDNNPLLQVVLTARNHVVGPWFAYYSRVQLSEFSQDKIRQLAMNWLDGDLNATNAFLSELEKIPDLKRLMGIPLLGTLIIAVFKNPRLKKLPENRIRLYEMFVELLCGGWDIARNITRESRYGSSVKLKMLSRLAGSVHQGRKREFDEFDLRTALSQTFAAFEPEWPEMLKDILQDGLIVRIGEQYAFSHLSFQEFLAAKDLLDPEGDKLRRALISFLRGEEWWREVISFYMGLSTAPHTIERWINKTMMDLRDVHNMLDPAIEERAEIAKGFLKLYFSGYQPVPARHDSATADPE
jgi:hypothetical protein